MSPEGDTGGSCPACGDPRRRRWDEEGEHLWLACRGCGTIRLTDPPTPGELAEYYGGYWSAPAGPVPPAVRDALDRIVHRFGRHRRTGRWLDVGFGRGELLESAEAAGWTVHGTELAEPSLAAARARGWTVARELDDPRFPEGGFDVVTIVEVIEHLLDPAGLVAAAVRKLRPGGALYLTTPNAGSLNARVLGARWSVFGPPEHLVIFTARGVRRMLRRCGVRVVRTETHGLNPVELRRRGGSARGGDGPAGDAGGGAGESTAGARVRSAAELNERMNSTAGLRMVKRMVNAGLTLLRAGDRLKVEGVRE